MSIDQPIHHYSIPCMEAGKILFLAEIAVYAKPLPNREVRLEYAVPRYATKPYNAILRRFKDMFNDVNADTFLSDLSKSLEGRVSGTLYDVDFVHALERYETHHEAAKKLFPFDQKSQKDKLERLMKAEETDGRKAQVQMHMRTALIRVAELEAARQ